MFLATKNSWLTFWGSRRPRERLAMCPAVLNTLSEGTLVPQMHRYFLAMLARFGKHPCSHFHQARGSASGSAPGKSR